MQPVRLHSIAAALVCGSLLLTAEQPAADPAESDTQAQLRSTYVLGPDDQIAIHATDADEISDKPVRVDTDGYIRLPMAGRVKVSGLTAGQLENELAARLKQYFNAPEVSVSMVEFRSQPVSVIGSVKTPGVHQLGGRKTLVEILSLAGGPAEDAGYSVKITRRLEWGRIPLPSAKDDASGGFSIAEISLQSIMEANDPGQNIVIRPNDVISVPRADLVYVIGQVEHAGGFVLRERQSVSVLEALSLAGGLGPAASPKNARILRPSPDGATRTEIAVDLKKILTGRAKDVPLEAQDILLVPLNAPKRAMIRAAEAAVQVGTGVAIYRF